jgi:hypothetical protein
MKLDTQEKTTEQEQNRTKSEMHASLDYNMMKRQSLEFQNQQEKETDDDNFKLLYLLNAFSLCSLHPTKSLEVNRATEEMLYRTTVGADGI